MNQIDILRKMNGITRLEQAFQLSDLVRELSLINIKHKYGRLAPNQYVLKLRERYLDDPVSLCDDKKA